MHIVRVVAPWPNGQTFPGRNLAFKKYFQKSVWNLSVEIFMTVFRQISISDTASFLTHLWYLIHFRDISKFDLTYFWQNFVTDRFQTLIWHISDSFLTDFCNWQFPDRFQTDFRQISETFGTNKSKEYLNSFPCICMQHFSFPTTRLFASRVHNRKWSPSRNQKILL